MIELRKIKMILLLAFCYNGLMKLEVALTILKNNTETVRQFGVKSLAVFGSTARNEAKETSDMDILVEFGRPIGLFEFIRLKLLLEKLLNCDVDLVTPDALHPALHDHILGEAIYVC